MNIKKITLVLLLSSPLFTPMAYAMDKETQVDHRHDKVIQQNTLEKISKEEQKSLVLPKTYPQNYKEPKKPKKQPLMIIEETLEETTKEETSTLLTSIDYPMNKEESEELSKLDLLYEQALGRLFPNRTELNKIFNDILLGKSKYILLDKLFQHYKTSVNRDNKQEIETFISDTATFLAIFSKKDVLGLQADLYKRIGALHGKTAKKNQWASYSYPEEREKNLRALQYAREFFKLERFYTETMGQVFAKKGDIQNAQVCYKNVKNIDKQLIMMGNRKAEFFFRQQSKVEKSGLSKKSSKK